MASRGAGLDIPRSTRLHDAGQTRPLPADSPLPSTRRVSPAPPDRLDDDSSSVDARMAELLATRSDLSEVRSRLREEDSDEAEDLLERIETLDFLDSMVGEVDADVPEQLGEFRIVGLLGRGGMGSVFEAFQESLERTVALKVLSPSLTSDPRMRRRFRAEARACANLHHPNIVPVYGFGETSGSLYFAMERVQGVSLDRHIARARHVGRLALEPRDAARRFAGVADALFHAHRRGLLHRDVKPGNVLVHPDGELALADFGLSKVVGEQSRSLSRAGGFMGTLQYAAPEQALGRDPSPASDLYGLGATLFECITGRLPIEGRTTEALLHAIVHEEAPPLRKVLRGAPRDLEMVLRKLLSKDPGDRYQDGETLARDLRRVADDEPVHVRRVPLSVRAWRQIRKHRGVSAAVAIALVATIVTSVLWGQFRDEERAKAIAQRQNHQTAAVARAETESGPAFGPDGLLSVLTGTRLVAADARSEVLDLLDQAEQVWPGDPQTARLRQAYLVDPIPEATRQLRRGDGLGARRLIDARIQEIETKDGFAERDPSTWLALYRLYVGRGLASLTAAVGDVEAAERDLIRASMIRPGAFLPRLLMPILAWDPAQPADAMLEQVDNLVARGPLGALDAAASFLLCFAGLARPAESELVQVEMTTEQRFELHRAALARLGRSGRELGELRAAGGPIERGLASPIRSALRAGRVTAEVLEHARILLEEQVGPVSPLRAWREVVAVLTDRDSPPARGRDGGELEPEVRLAGLEKLLALDPPNWLVGALDTRVRSILDEGGPVLAASACALRVRAMLGRRAEVDVAAALAQAWVDEDPYDARAYVCRFEAHLRAGAYADAAWDVVTAFQHCAVPAQLRELFRGALARHPRPAGLTADAATAWGQIEAALAGG